MVNVTLAEKYAIIGGLVLAVMLGSSATFTKSAFAVCTKSGVCAATGALVGKFNIASTNHNIAGAAVCGPPGCAIHFGGPLSAASNSGGPKAPNIAVNGHTTVTSP